MRPLPPRFFGPSGLPCIFTVDDDSGATAIGYLVKQIGTRRFVVSNGSTTRTATLAQNAEDVADSHTYPPATCSIFLLLYDSTVEHIKYLTEFRCSTIEDGAIAWHTAEATPTIGSITTPSLGGGLVLQGGGYWLLEDGSHWELEV